MGRSAERFHKEERGLTIKGLAPGLRVTAWSADGVVEAVEADWYPAAGVQFHPERLDVLDGEFAWERFFARLDDFAGPRPALPCARRPIGVFDSGVGGLSVLEKLLTIDAFDNETGEERPDGRPDFENEEFVYFDDQGNMPYGRYDAAGKAEFLRELVVRDAQFVLGGAGHEPSKAVVIACNTATAYGLERLQAMPRPHDAPVIGVVPSGAEAAYAALKDEPGRFAVGVMATPATIASGAYERALRKCFGDGLEIAVRGGIGLAEAVENNEPGMADCARTNMIALVEDYRRRGGTAPSSTGATSIAATSARRSSPWPKRACRRASGRPSDGFSRPVTANWASERPHEDRLLVVIAARLWHNMRKLNSQGFTRWTLSRPRRTRSLR